jgi:sugar/nucleoside kinase (ribokinase family)
MTDDNAVLVLGSIALDTLEIDNHRYSDLVGGSTTYATLSAGRFVPIHIVGIIGDDFLESGHRIFDTFANDISDLEVKAGPTFRWGGRYHSDMNNRDTLFTELGVFEDYSPKLTGKNRDIPYVFLANIHPELQMTVIDQLSRNSVIVTDTMNLWINTTRTALEHVIGKTTILLVNESEADLLTGISNQDRAAEKLLEMGPEQVIIKCGNRGAVQYSGNEKTVIGTYPVKKVIDPTGAGDSFGGGFIAALANGAEIKDALIRGTAMASICVEGIGTAMLEQTDEEEILVRERYLLNKVIP